MQWHHNAGVWMKEHRGWSTRRLAGVAAEHLLWTGVPTWGVVPIHTSRAVPYDVCFWSIFSFFSAPFSNSPYTWKMLLCFAKKLTKHFFCLFFAMQEITSDLLWPVLTSVGGIETYPCLALSMWLGPEWVLVNGCGIRGWVDGGKGSWMLNYEFWTIYWKL